MKSTEIPAKMTVLGRLGYLLIIVGGYLLLNIALYALLQVHAAQFDRVALFLLLMVLGYALLRQDPVYKAVGYKMLLNASHPADIKRRRVGSSLFFFGAFFIAMETQGLQTFPALLLSWPYFLLSAVCLCVGAALVLLKEPRAATN